MDLDELLKKVKSSGGRITKARMIILEYLLLCDRPVSAAEISVFFQKKGILPNRTTVYRELLFLVKNGLTREVRLNGKPSLFELAGEHRHHLICLKCRCIKPIIMGNHLKNHEKKIMEKEKFRITSHSLEFYGLCEKCQ